MLGGWEWLIILLVVVVIILWGPSKIPDLARAVGRAKGEFEKASREYSYGSSKIETAESKMSNDDMILLIAKGLGINTEGKSRDQIFLEITSAIKTSKTSS